MATPKKQGKEKKGRQVRVVFDQPDDPGDLLPPEARQKSQEEEDIEEVLTGLPQESKIELWKWDAPEKDEWNYVGRHPVHGFSLDSVSREHGGGKYRMIVRGPKEGDDGRTRIVQLARRHFAVAGQRGAQTDGGLGIGLADMFKMNMEMMRTMVMAPRENMADLVRAIHEMSAPKTDPMQVTLQLMQLLKTDKTAISEMLDVLRTGMELAESKGGGDADGLVVFGKAVQAIAEKLPGKAAEQPRPAIAPGAAPAPQLQDPAAQNRAFFDMATRTMRAASMKDADIDLYAEWIVDQVEDLPSLHPFLQQWFLDPTYPEMLYPLFEGVRTPWLKAVLLRCRDIATGAEEALEEAKKDDDGNHGDSGGGQGDGGDAPPHAPPGKREPVGSGGEAASGPLN